MRAIFRVDASPAIGLGHLSRCLTLARALARRGAAIDVAIRRPSDHARAWIEREGYQVVTIADGDDDLAVTRRLAGAGALVVVDGYSFAATYHEALRGDGRVVCVIDDLERPLGGDLIVNGNLYAEELPYGAGARLLLGPRYALVREEFVAARAARLARGATHGRPRLLVTMGGADPTRETEKAIGALARVSRPLDVRVIVGGANPRHDAVRAAAAHVSPRHTLDLHFDVRAMGEAMVWADVALTAAGSTCLELACVGVASVVIVVADNQRRVGEALVRHGLMPSLGWHATVDEAAVARALDDLLTDEPSRRAVEEAQRSLVDGLGASRVAAALVGCAPEA